MTLALGKSGLTGGRCRLGLFSQRPLMSQRSFWGKNKVDQLLKPLVEELRGGVEEAKVGSSRRYL